MGGGETIGKSREAVSSQRCDNNNTNTNKTSCAKWFDGSGGIDAVT